VATGYVVLGTPQPGRLCSPLRPDSGLCVSVRVGQGPHCVRNRTRKRRVAKKCGALRRSACHGDVGERSAHSSLGHVCCFSSLTRCLANVSAGVLTVYLL
jgi:hypothetical protein